MGESMDRELNSPEPQYRESCTESLKQGRESMDQLDEGGTHHCQPEVNLNEWLEIATTTGNVVQLQIWWRESEFKGNRSNRGNRGNTGNKGSKGNYFFKGKEEKNLRGLHGSLDKQRRGILSRLILIPQFCSNQKEKVRDIRE